MATTRYANPSTQGTKASALASFERFLTQNQLSVDAVKDLIQRADGGAAFVRVMDRYALHLATVHGARGHLLSSDTALLYYGAVKNWFYDWEPSLQVNERKVKTIADVVDKEYKRRDDGSGSKQAPPCLKSDLKMMVQRIYSVASNESDYWDAALLVLMWHLFGRSSDMESVNRRSFAVLPGGALTVRVGRIKTALEQGLSLFVDVEFLTCPIHSIAVAAVSDIVPASKLFRQLPARDHGHDEINVDEMPLLDFLQDHIDMTAGVKGGGRRSPGIHAYINRLLRRLENTMVNTGLTPGLSSHSFRRGGAQAANASSKLSLQWILDRGGWQLSAMNKAFSYIFNSTSEDQQVAKVLSGWEADMTPWTPSLHHLDSTVQANARLFRTSVFRLRELPEVEEFCFRADVLDAFTASIIFNYPDMVKLLPNSVYHHRVKSALRAHGFTENDITAWSLALRHERLTSQSSPKQAPPNHRGCCRAGDGDLPGIKALFQEHFEITRQFMEKLDDLSKRVTSLERRVNGEGRTSDTDNEADAPALTQPSLRLRAQPADLLDVWQKWYARTSPLWDKNEKSASRARQRFSDIRYAVGYMRVFLPSPYTLDRNHDDYTAEVIRLGTEAKEHVLQFLSSHGSKSSSVGTVTRDLKAIDKTGALDARKRLFQMRVNTAQVIDPTPAEHLMPWK